MNPFAGMRKEYSGSLLEQDLAGSWPEQFGRWLAEATAAGLPEPNAAALATADARGVPSARFVLLKSYAEDGFTFFTNFESRKGREAAENPNASLVFGWLPMHRQVVVCGGISPIDRIETEQYFAERPRGAQLGAWASAQSSVIASRAELEASLAAVDQRFGPDAPVPAPPHWGGLRLRPVTVEFWQGRPDRLHDRLRFRRTPDGWVVERLSP